MLGFFECGKTKYKVDYCGEMSFYDNAKETYTAGETVELYYKFIATDTSYHFYLDGEDINYNYEDKKGFVISFVMPQHDVKLECVSKNTMLYDPSQE